jgi:hypothetical protein
MTWPTWSKRIRGQNKTRFVPQGYVFQREAYILGFCSREGRLRTFWGKRCFRKDSRGRTGRLVVGWRLWVVGLWGGLKKKRKKRMSNYACEQKWYLWQAIFALGVTRGGNGI